jgi:hypothetical protein
MKSSRSLQSTIRTVIGSNKTIQRHYQPSGRAVSHATRNLTSSSPTPGHRTIRQQPQDLSNSFTSYQSYSSSSRQTPTPTPTPTMTSATVETKTDNNNNNNNNSTSNTQPEAQPASTSETPLPALPPTSSDASSSSSSSSTLEVGGAALRLDHLGPLVVNEDGTLSRIANWEKMADVERENTLRILGKRNQMRLAKLRAAKSEEAGNSESEIQG